MKQVSCESCGKEISPQASACPACGHPNKRSKDLNAAQVIGALLLAGFGAWWYFGGGMVESAQPTMDQITAKVATDAVDQYNIAKRQGDVMQICVQGEAVAAAYLQAKDESNYKQWKATSVEDCKRAGVSN